MASVEPLAKPVKPLPASGRPVAQSKNVPGPGAYDVKSPTNTKAPTMHGRIVEAEHFITPGPGEYDVPDTRNMNTAPTFQKLSNTSNAANNTRNKQPDPGTYFEDQHPLSVGHGSPKVTMHARVPTSTKSSSIAPGPGAYEPKFVSVDPNPPAPKVVAPSKAPKHEDYQVPAPGTYNVSGKPSGKALPFSSRLESNTGSVGPGPGGKVTAPGPGEYGAPMPKSSAPQYSFFKNTPHKTNETPAVGPGATYNVPREFDDANDDKKKSKLKGPKIVAPINETPRERMSEPGPGQYDLQRFGDGTKKRTNAYVPQAIPEKVDSRPGPGSFDVVYGNIAQKVGKKKSHSFIGGRTNTVTGVQQVPGPGAYDVSPPKGAARTMGQKLDRPVATEFITPGPGEYEQPNFSTNTAILFSQTGGTGGNSNTKPKSSPSSVVAVPGPGSYDNTHKSIAGEVDAKPGVFFNGRNKTQDKSAHTPRPTKSESLAATVPGPGSYTPRPPQASCGVKMVKSDNHHASRAMDPAGPGPDRYHIRSSFDDVERKRGFTFGDVPLPPTSAMMEVPGPGNYTVDDSRIRRDVHGTKIVAPSTDSRKDKEQRDTSPVPGPGSYDISNLNKNVNGITFHQRVHKPQTHSTVPGPADYYPKPAASTAAPKFAPPVHTPKEDVSTKKQQEQLGPGEYSPKTGLVDILESKAHIGITMKGRAPDNTTKQVAPGAIYDVANHLGIGQSGPKITLLGRNGEKRNEKSNFPSPAQYDVTVDATKNTKPMYSLGMRPTPKKGTDWPGPGEYTLPSTLVGKGAKIGTGA